MCMGAILAALSVAAGAFGAHGLEGVLSHRYLEIYHTAVRYMMFHSLGILFLSLSSLLGGPDLRKPAWALAGGVLFFSGSLFLLVATGTGILGAVTPIGGVLFIVGWLWSAWKIIRFQR